MIGLKAFRYVRIFIFDRLTHRRMAWKIGTYRLDDGQLNENSDNLRKVECYVFDITTHCTFSQRARTSVQLTVIKTRCSDLPETQVLCVLNTANDDWYSGSLKVDDFGNFWLSLALIRGYPPYDSIYQNDNKTAIIFGMRDRRTQLK